MAKGKRNSKWKQKVLEWQSSGKSGAAWCRENNIPYTTLAGWKNRFNQSKQNQAVVDPEAFIELKDQMPPNSGVSLDYHGMKIHLEPGFNVTVFKQCLECLRGVLC